MKLSKTYAKINATTIGDYFMYWNESLTKIDLPYVKIIGDYVMYYNESIVELNLPHVQTIGNYFLWNNKYITKEQFIS